MEQILNELLKNGVLGILCCCLLIAVGFLWRKLDSKDQEIKELQTAKTKDQEAFLAKAMDLQEKVFLAGNRFDGVASNLGQVINALKELLAMRGAPIEAPQFPMRASQQDIRLTNPEIQMVEVSDKEKA